MKYQNPIIRGFNPDPSICRAGDGYYLVTSSFEYFPAIPIYHSKDLANWKQIGNCVSFENAIDLRKMCESGGIWAPTIRYENGIFYVTAAVEKHGNFIIHTENPCGAWSKPVWVDIGGIDPSLFFEDGKAYYCTNDRLDEEKEAICLGVVDPFTGETAEPFQIIWYGTGGGWMEAPHLYHIGEWYYIMTAEGGTTFGHHETIARSKNIWGPYENCPYNPILTNRNDTDKQAHCCGHGDLLEDMQGNWWMVYLGHRSGPMPLSQLGRETFLSPVQWVDGWPVVVDRKACIEVDGPIHREQLPWNGYTDDFEKQEWPGWWYFVRNPEMSHYKRGNGSLTIEAFGGKPTAENCQGFVGTKQPDFDFELMVNLDSYPENEGDAAGVMIRLAHNFYYFFGVRKIQEKVELFLERKTDDLYVVTFTEEIKADTKLRLWVKGDKAFYTFGLRNEENARIGKCTASTRFLSCEMPGRCFTGTMIGLYAESVEKNGAQAEFSEFVIKNK